MQDIISRLLEDDNPAVKYRTQTELLNEHGDKAAVKAWIFDKIPKNWFETPGLWYCYYITALSECGLSREDIPTEYLERAFTQLQDNFECGCEDFMLLTSLLKLGFSEHQTIGNIIEKLEDYSLPDGGFLCLHRLNKLKYTPKSCYKANLHALMFFSQCHKHKINTAAAKPLIDYFLKRNVHYKTTDSKTLVLNSREGWRTTDTFYPFEVMRVGLVNIVEAFAALGYGDHQGLFESWDILESCKDSAGMVILKGTLTKSYLPKERTGKPSKWVTFYALLSEQQREKFSV